MEYKFRHITTEYRMQLLLNAGNLIQICHRSRASGASPLLWEVALFQCSTNLHQMLQLTSQRTFANQAVTLVNKTLLNECPFVCGFHRPGCMMLDPIEEMRDCFFCLLNLVKWERWSGFHSVQGYKHKQECRCLAVRHEMLKCVNKRTKMGSEH